MALIGSLNSGISALRNFARGLEVIGNNIANVNSVAFKGATTHYTDSFSQFLSKPVQFAVGWKRFQSRRRPRSAWASRSPASRSNFLQGAISSDRADRPTWPSRTTAFFRCVNVPDNTVFATRAGDFRTD